MSEYIEREAAYEKCGWYNTVNGKSVYAVRKDELAAITAADVAPVVHGRWELHGNDDDLGSSYWCSNCRSNYDEDWFYQNGEFRPFKLCPHCGARMDGE